MKVVIPCVDYSDYLRYTLPAWRKKIDADFVVVTTHEDEKTHHVATDNHAKIISTERFYEDGAKFNKAYALDLGLAYALDGEVCITMDADSYPGNTSFPKVDVKSKTIYGCKRYSLPNSLEEELLLGPNNLVYEPPANLPFIKENGREDSPWSCGGYFQMFRYDHRREYGSYPTAALYDYKFAFKFPFGVLINFFVIHLGERKKNWEGRVTPEFKI